MKEVKVNRPRWYDDARGYNPDEDPYFSSPEFLADVLDSYSENEEVIS